MQYFLRKRLNDEDINIGDKNDNLGSCTFHVRTPNIDSYIRRIVYEAEADDENRNDAKWSRIDPIQFQRLKKEKKKSECKQSENSFFTAFICYI